MKIFLPKNVLPLITLATTIVLIIFIGYKYFNEYPKATIGSLINQNEKDAVNYLLELNKFLISICTLLFGLIGFYLSKYRKEIYNKWIAISYFISIIFLGSSYFFSIKVYSSIVEQISEGFIGLKPGSSIVMFYQEMSYWTMLGTSILLLSIFFNVFLKKD